MRFFGRVALDGDFSGMALSDREGDRVADLMGEGKTVLLMANHGVLVIGPHVAAAFDEMYYFERAAETLLTCYAAGKPLRIVPDTAAALTERQWRDYGQLAIDHLDNVKAILDVEEPAQALVLIEAGPAVYLLEGSHLRAAQQFLSGLSPDDRVAVVKYADAPQGPQ